MTIPSVPTFAGRDAGIHMVWATGVFSPSSSSAPWRLSSGHIQGDQGTRGGVWGRLGSDEWPPVNIVLGGHAVSVSVSVEACQTRGMPRRVSLLGRYIRVPR